MSTNPRQHAWVTIVLSLIVASFLGGAIRVLLGPDQVSNWLEQVASKNRLKFEFEFDEAKVSLASGAIPRFGVEISGLKLRAKDPCVTGSQVHIKDIYIPVSLTQLFQQKLKFKTLTIGEMSLDLVEALCNPQQEKQFSAPVAEEVATEEVSVSPSVDVAKRHFQKFSDDTQSFFHHRYKKEIKNTRQWLDGIVIGRLDIFKQAGSEISSIGRFRDFSVLVPEGDAPLVVEMEWEFAPEFAWNLKGTKFRPRLEIDQKEIRAHIGGQ